MKNIVLDEGKTRLIATRGLLKKSGSHDKSEFACINMLNANSQPHLHMKNVLCATSASLHKSHQSSHPEECN